MAMLLRPSAAAALAPGAHFSALFGALLAALCAGPLVACGDDAQVPFGLETTSRGGSPGTTPETHPGANGAPRDPDAPFTATEGTSFPAGTRSVAIEGAPLTTADDIRALLTSDVDGDGDRDVILVEASGTTGRVLFARRDDAAFAPLVPLGGRLEEAPDCEVSGASIATISPRFAAARVTRACAPEGGEDRDAEGGEASESVWILSLDGTPRVHEQVVVLPSPGRAPGAVQVTLDVRDVDEDGHRDVVLEVAVTAETGGAPAATSVAWLDRPSGLARDTAEPEASLMALADTALEELGGDRAGAVRDARRALALFGALCREAGAPRVRFGTSDGLPCGASVGAGRAAAALTAGLARGGEVFAALDAFDRLGEDGYRVPARARRLATEAMASMATTEGISEWVGPSVTLPPGPDARLPVIAFLDATHLLIRGASPSVIDLEAPDEAAAPVEQGTDVLLTDPSGRHAATAIERTCDGYVVSIVRADDVVAGVVAGRPVSTPLFAPAAAPSGARCPTLPDDVRRDDGGFRILGWAPQGIVLARRDELRLVPLTVDAALAGTARRLGPDDPTPAPLHGGAATPDGSAYALRTALGFALHRRGATQDAVRLVQPPAWDAASVSPLDVAVSPDLTRIAFVAGGRVRTIAWPPRAER